MSRFTSFKRFFLRKRIYIPTIIILALAGWAAFGNKGSANEELVTVQSTTFVQEVGVTGKVVPAKDVDMAFETGGRVSKVNVKVGNTVKAGQVLASVDFVAREGFTVGGREAELRTLLSRRQK